MMECLAFPSAKSRCETFELIIEHPCQSNGINQTQSDARAVLQGIGSIELTKSRLTSLATAILFLHSSTRQAGSQPLR